MKKLILVIVAASLIACGGSPGSADQRVVPIEIAAEQREAEMEEEKNPFEDLNILKLLENGAWVGIGLFPRRQAGGRRPTTALHA